MPMYHRLGQLAPTKHTTFRKPDGSLYWEELFSTLGFAGIYSTFYRLNQPAAVQDVRELELEMIETWPDAPVQPHHLFTGRLEGNGNLLSGRQYLMYNDDCALATARFGQDPEFLYRNAKADEILFVHEGKGVLHSECGELPFGQWDYLVIPRGLTYRIEGLPGNNRFFVIESYGPVETPARYRNEFGQLLEHSPFHERDIRLPQYREPIDRTEPTKLWVKSYQRVFEYTLDHHPFDVVGWDGYLYPWAFNIKDFNPIVGRIHQPPPVHQVFKGQGMVVCNFVPRLFDFHTEAIPAPYYHQNVDSDEVLYYVDGDFMSRKGIEPGSITLHPGDVPHGPQPGKVEASIGKKDCYEYAVMVDTFRPLKLTRAAQNISDANYLQSWLKR